MPRPEGGQFDGKKARRRDARVLASACLKIMTPRPPAHRRMLAEAVAARAALPGLRGSARCHNPGPRRSRAPLWQGLKLAEIKSADRREENGLMLIDGPRLRQCSNANH